MPNVRQCRVLALGFSLLSLSTLSSCGFASNTRIDSNPTGAKVRVYEDGALRYEGTTPVELGNVGLTTTFEIATESGQRFRGATGQMRRVADHSFVAELDKGR